MAEMAKRTVQVDSIKKSHRHELMPRKPWKKYSMDAAAIPPNAPESRLPEYRIEVRRASSSFVYHEDSKKRAPGKNGLAVFSRLNHSCSMSELTLQQIRGRIVQIPVPKILERAHSYQRALPMLSYIRAGYYQLFDSVANHERHTRYRLGRTRVIIRLLGICKPI
jgi:hypothetical protein